MYMYLYSKDCNYLYSDRTDRITTKIYILK